MLPHLELFRAALADLPPEILACGWLVSLSLLALRLKCGLPVSVCSSLSESESLVLTLFLDLSDNGLDCCGTRGLGMDCSCCTQIGTVFVGIVLCGDVGLGIGLVELHVICIILLLS